MASAIEQSVRRALQKGNAADPDFRLVVYEAAERAILRVQSAQHSDEAEADRKRLALISAIEAIEAEYPPTDTPAGHQDAETAVPAAGTDGASAARADTPEVMAPPTNPSGATGETTLPKDASTPPPRKPVAAASPAPAGKPRASAKAPEPAPRGARPARDRWSHDDRSKRSRLRGAVANKLVSAVIVILLVALLVAAVWIILPLFTGGPALETAERAPTIAETIQSASDDPAAGGVSPDSWIAVFAGTELEKIAAEAGAQASAVAGAGGKMAVQIASPADGDGSEISLVIGAGVVEEIAGSRARGELAVGSPDAEPREFSVSCLFAGETVCGRQRFQVNAEEQTFVFDMTVPEGAMGAAQLVIDPQIGAGAGDLNVYGFRVQTIE